MVTLRDMNPEATKRYWSIHLGDLILHVCQDFFSQAHGSAAYCFELRNVEIFRNLFQKQNSTKFKQLISFFCFSGGWEA